MIIRPLLSMKPVSPLTTTGNSLVCSRGRWPAETDAHVASVRTSTRLRILTSAIGYSLRGAQQLKPRDPQRIGIGRCHARMRAEIVSSEEDIDTRMGGRRRAVRDSFTI